MILKPFKPSSAIARLDNEILGADDDEIRSLQRQRANAIKGTSGEREIARAIDRHFGPSRRLGVLHDVIIRARDVTVQVDHLLISTFLSTAWLVETKNLSGTLSVNSDGEWLQTVDGTSHVIPSPLEQAQSATFTVRAWLIDAGYGVVEEVFPIVVVPHTTTIDRQTINTEHVVKADMLGKWWDEDLNDRSLAWLVGRAIRYMRRGLAEEDLRKLGADLVAQDLEVRGDLTRKPKNRPYGGLVDGWEIAPGIYARRTVLGIAIRHASDETLVRRVSAAASPIGTWHDRYSNWIVPEARLDEFTRRFSAEAAS